MYFPKPPEMCDFQMKTATYVLSFSDGNSSWSTSPKSISNRVMFSDKTHFIRDKQYTVTATVMTGQGRVSSAMNFSMIGIPSVKYKLTVIFYWLKNWVTPSSREGHYRHHYNNGV